MEELMSIGDVLMILILSLVSNVFVGAGSIAYYSARATLNHQCLDAFLNTLNPILKRLYGENKNSVFRMNHHSTFDYLMSVSKYAGIINMLIFSVTSLLFSLFIIRQLFAIGTVLDKVGLSLLLSSCLITWVYFWRIGKGLQDKC